MTTDMIIKDLPRLCETPLPTTVVLLPQSEELRRAQIITELVRGSFIYVGQRVRPVSDEIFMKRGYARIIGLADTYTKYKGSYTDTTVPWPDDDNPLIVAASYENDNYIVNATTNYFRAD